MKVQVTYENLSLQISMPYPEKGCAGSALASPGPPLLQASRRKDSSPAYPHNNAAVLSARAPVHN